jgi:hypothetical protein
MDFIHPNLNGIGRLPSPTRLSCLAPRSWRSPLTTRSCSSRINEISVIGKRDGWVEVTGEELPPHGGEEDIDGVPLLEEEEDIDGVPLQEDEEDIDGVPLGEGDGEGEEDIDGVPLDV